MAELGIHQTLPDKYWFRDENGTIAGLARVLIAWWVKLWGGLYGYPGTILLTVTPKGGDNGGKLRPEWVPYFQHPKINPDPRAWPVLSKINAGYFNTAAQHLVKMPNGRNVPDVNLVPVIHRLSDDQYYVIGEIEHWTGRELSAEGIVAISDEVGRYTNLVNVLERKNDAVRIQTLATYNDLPPDPDKVNPKTHPHLFFLFTSSEKDGGVGLVQGVPIYIPILSRVKDIAWLPGEAVKPYHPAIPNEPETTAPEAPTMSERAQGIDFAVENQVRYRPETVEVPHDFVVMKLTQGRWLTETSWYYNTFNPKRTALQMALDIANSPRRLFYHMVDVLDGNYQQQGDTFLENVDRAEQAMGKPVHKLVADMEKNRVNEVVWDAPRYWVYGKLTVDLIRYVEDRRQQEMLLYTNPTEWQNVYNSGLRAPELIDRDHWFAQYPFRIWNPDVVQKAQSGEWSPWTPAVAYFKGAWKMWQYSADENGAVSLGKNKHGVESHAVDLDVFNGTVAEMDTWLGIGGSAPEPQPEPEPDADIEAQIAAALEAERAEIIEYIEGRP
jgi:GH25 family lysozyme M1 (1,4-beta-N-acetylmuramidase)